MVGVLTGGREPTTDERLASVESRVNALSEQVDERFFEARKQADARIDEALKQAYAADKEIDDELRRGLADVLAGGICGRVIGVVRLFAGIVLSVAGTGSARSARSLGRGGSSSTPTRSKAITSASSVRSTGRPARC